VSDDLYQRAILERAKAPARRLDSPSASVTVDNPLCGDRVTLDVMLENGAIAAIGHQVRGCALCQASAAVIAATLTGQALAAAGAGRAALDSVLKGGAAQAPWQELAIFAPVQRHKSRQDCVRLPFEALAQALAQAKT
jgi:nitrogen fixation NifU-like protein